MRADARDSAGQLAVDGARARAGAREIGFGSQFSDLCDDGYAVRMRSCARAGARAYGWIRFSRMDMRIWTVCDIRISVTHDGFDTVYGSDRQWIDSTDTTMVQWMDDVPRYRHQNSG